MDYTAENYTAENYTAGNYTAGFPSFWEGEAMQDACESPGFSILTLRSNTFRRRSKDKP